jgi:uncharacterized protein (DUF342 family)
LNDMAATVTKLQGLIKEGTLTKELAMPGVTRLMHEGAHIGAHMKFLAYDKSKEPVLKEYAANLNIIQRSVEQLQQQMAEMLQAQQDQQGQFDPANDPDIAKKLALAQIEIDVATKIAQIKMSSMAQMNETRDQIVKDTAATKIAVERAKAKSAAKQPQPKPKEGGNPPPSR